MMEKKLVIVPFDVELAKKITNGEVEGRIVTRDERSSRVVCWDRKNSKLSIVALTSDKNGMENIMSFTKDGAYWENGGSDDRDLMIEIPEYMTFKDGDILSYDNGTFILKRFDGKNRIEYYANSYDCYYRLSFDSACINTNIVDKIRPASEEEKHKLINALKASKEPKAKEYLKRFFGIEVKQECEFKPFDKVLVRDYDDGVWKADIFFNNSDGCYMCTGNVIWAQCIPYNEQTAHLLGTNKDCKE